MRRRWAYRAAEPELMDDPEADEAKLLRTVRQFRLINTLLTRSRFLIRKQIFRDALRRGLDAITVLDLGAGGGDIALWAVRAGRRAGIAVRVICLDSDPRIAAYARENVANNAAVSVVEASAEELSDVGAVDYIFSNHLLHHLDDGTIAQLLAQIDEAARYGYVLNDIRRSRLSYAGYSILAGVVFHGGFTREDGLLSIRRGFRRLELQTLLKMAGLEQKAVVRPLFPGRLAIISTRPM